jgi:hypothetical protein
MTNDELKRQADYRRVPGNTDSNSNKPSRQVAGGFSAQDNQVAITLNALVKYIPTEVVTLYVAAASTAQSLKSAISMPVIDGRLLYWGFTVLTPILLVLMYASKRATDGLPALPKARELPWWKMTAATVAFAVWALAVPGNPYVSGDGAPIVAGFGAIIISTLLSLLEPIFERPLTDNSSTNVPSAPIPSAPAPLPGSTKPPLTPPGGMR